MGTKHTPGPWELKKTRARIEVATPARGGCYAFTHNDEANARLIASAPDLLAALQECVTDDNATCIVTNDVAYMIRRLRAINAMARAAIAKATGVQQ